jgi:uncharacterized protein
MLHASRSFQIFAKPVGALCNMECRYCYYVGKQPSNAEIALFRMPEKLLELYIAQHIAASIDPVVTFSWHGGEPTLLGLSYFRMIVALQEKYRPRDKRISNGIQTNGLLLDEEWCRFLSAEHFGIGLSVDGPAELHDPYRRTRGNAATHAQTIQAFELLRKYDISCDILCAVHDRNVLQPVRVYRYLKELGARYLGFLPVVERISGAIPGPHTVPAHAFGEFLCAIFDEWKDRDIGRVSVQIFEEAARTAQGIEHSLCIFRKRCGDIPVVEHDGDFYSCDHFVDEKHWIGNIRQASLPELLDNPKQKAFGEAKWNALPRYCRQCDVLDMCNGGCPKDRFIRTPDGEPGLNFLCEGFKKFFMHSRPFFRKVVALSKARQVSKERVGRNDPCPCGSGLKYKKCCFGKEKQL